jgi:hypothetical protein
MPRNNAASAADPLENHKRYEKTKNLNAGAFGFVQLARDKLNKGACVAVKFIPRGEHVNEYVEAEIINHRQLLHPHIIQFQEVKLDFLLPALLLLRLMRCCMDSTTHSLLFLRRRARKTYQCVFPCFGVAVQRLRTPDPLERRGSASRHSSHGRSAPVPSRKTHSGLMKLHEHI